jgi:radical SAM superfamily enzyme YgiQ (UPF0313 family)
MDEAHPTLVFISVAYGSQLLEALCLLDALRNDYPDVVTVVGGGLVNSCIRSPEDVSGPIAELANYIYVGDGELLLASLAASGPEIMHRCSRPAGERARHVTAARLAKEEGYEETTPPPDFAQCAPEQYLSPRVVLPYRFRSDCYWGRCVFCVDHVHGTHLHPVRNMAAHLDRIEALVCRHDACGISLLDSAVRPSELAAFAEGVIARGLPIVWQTNARFEKELCADGLLETLYEGGCRFLRFGLESASASVIRRMKKGTDLQTARRILMKCRDVGILSHTYVMIGFPEETEDDRRQTREFVLDPDSRPDGLSITQFTLYRDSELGRKLAVGKRRKDGWHTGERGFHSEELDAFEANLVAEFFSPPHPCRVLMSPAHTVALYDSTRTWHTPVEEEKDERGHGHDKD